MANAVEVQAAGNLSLAEMIGDQMYFVSPQCESFREPQDADGSAAGCREGTRRHHGDPITRAHLQSQVRIPNPYGATAHA